MSASCFRQIRVAYEPHGVRIANLPVRRNAVPGRGFAGHAMDVVRDLVESHALRLRDPCELHLTDHHLVMVWPRQRERFPLDQIDSWQLTESALRLWVRVGHRTLRHYDLAWGWPERSRRWLSGLIERAQQRRFTPAPPPPRALQHLRNRSLS